MKKAVVLLSGGLDSATTIHLAKSKGFEIYALSFNYGQRRLHELECAKEIAKKVGVSQHKFPVIDLNTFGKSALTNTEIQIPKDRGLDQIGLGIPTTYVPARNTIFLSFALAYAEVVGALNIFIGVNTLDYSGYPDCRPEFIKAFQKMAALATKISVEQHKSVVINTPLISLTKTQIIKLGIELGVDYKQTSSCYDPSDQGKACARCDACILRIKGFQENGTEDPKEYV